MREPTRKLLAWLILSGLLAMLSACRIEAWGGEEAGDGFSFFFSINPRSDERQIPVINPGVDQGRLVLVWSVDGTHEAWVTYFLSHDNRRDSSDLLIGESLCSSALRGCSRKTREVCQFTLSMRLLCGVGDPSDVSLFFHRLPQRAFIIARACSSERGRDCDERAQQVEFQ